MAKKIDEMKYTIISVENCKPSIKRNLNFKDLKNWIDNLTNTEVNGVYYILASENYIYEIRTKKKIDVMSMR